jgi:hypothetical protein
MANKGLILLALGGAAAYLTKDKWLPQAEAAVGYQPAGGASTPLQPPGTTTGNNQPIGPGTPGATPLGNGCYSYRTGTDSSLVISCPPGVNPPPAGTTPDASICQSGYTLDPAGVCVKYGDAYLLANLNTIPWTGLSDIPAEQIYRIDPQILQFYVGQANVNGGTALAYMLGLGAGSAPDGTMTVGADGNSYKLQQGVYYRQGTGTRLNGLRTLARALPITSAVLIQATVNPAVAQLLANDPRALLTAAQWNAYYTQASGVLQALDLSLGQPAALINAMEYQRRRRSAGLQTVARLGTMRTARRGAFPLGAINQWVHPGNRNIYQIPGRGAVPAGRGGMIPAPKPFARMGLIHDGGGNHRSKRSPFPRPTDWRQAF